MKKAGRTSPQYEDKAVRPYEEQNKENAMLQEPMLEKPKYAVKQPKNLSPRIQWLRDYYFQGVQAPVEQ